ncbi:MAG: 4-hydroxybenzoyl-CoA reductase subunit alpha [Hyphomicrobiales bacterium]|nr:4-hydroxybenzoyl-CoA reductase subunit alpha [Hyphomicrobiales bacterium]
MNIAEKIAKKPSHVVGKPSPLVDGIEKVTGRAKYSADLPFADAYAGAIYRSPYAHAEILELDLSAARALNGVIAIVTGEDCAETYGVLPVAMNEYCMARDRVRYRGEPVAAVAAANLRTAKKALSLIKMKVRELPEYQTVAEARAPDAVLLHDNKPGNLEREVHDSFGDVPAGFETADLVRENSYHCAEVTHMQMEPNACLAEYDVEREELILKTCTQVPYYVHLMLARCMDMDSSRIRVIKPFVGGGFGHRSETLNFELIAGLLARAAKGKVALHMSREETILTHRGRPETDIKVKIGLTKEGRITAAECEVVQIGGAYGGYGIVTVLYSGNLMHAIYDIPATKYDGYRVYANRPPCGAMRGHGTVDMRYAFESLLDEMAIELELDPFEVRRQNLLTAPTETMNGLKVTSYGLPECLDKVEAASDWKKRIGKLPPGRGLGMACSHYVSGAAKPVNWTGEPHATVNVKLDFDGGVTILTGASDIGQGSSTIVTLAVAEVCKLDMGRIRVIANDSAITPKDNGSYSSRVTYMVGNAAIDAAKNLNSILVAAAAAKLDAKPEDIEVDVETYRVSGSQDPGLSFKEVVREALVDTGTITVKGTFTVPKEFQGGKHRGGAVGSTMGFSYAAVVAEVEVDQDTGQVRVEKVWAAQDCGYAINPLAVEGQIQGAVWMGLGQALSEGTRFHGCLPLHGNMLDYRVPTIVESPPIETYIVESIDPNGPFGAKEASEGALAAFLPALTAAVANATGLRVTELPVTPDLMVEALARKQHRDRVEKARKTAA